MNKYILITTFSMLLAVQISADSSTPSRAKKACKQGDAKECITLGAMYANGYGVKKNYTKAKKLFKKACNAGYVQGCNNFNVLNKREDT